MVEVKIEAEPMDIVTMQIYVLRKRYEEEEVETKKS